LTIAFAEGKDVDEMRYFGSEIPVVIRLHPQLERILRERRRLNWECPRRGFLWPSIQNHQGNVDRLGGNPKKARPLGTASQQRFAIGFI